MPAYPGHHGRGEAQSDPTPTDGYQPRQDPGPVNGRSAFFELSADLCAVFVDDGRFAAVNSHWERVLGWSKAELIGKHWTYLIHPDDQIGTQEVIETPGLWENPFENRYRHRNGSYRRLRWRGILGNREWLGIAQDITPDLQLQTDLAVRSLVLDTIDASVVLSDLNGSITDWNRAAEHLHGWSRDEVLGKDLVELTIPAGQRSTAEDLSELRAFERDVDLLRSDGSVVAAHVRSKPLVAADGSVIGMAGFAIDLTERIEAERASTAAREHLLAITESMGEGLLVLDSKGVVTSINASAELLLGWKANELKGKVILDSAQPGKPDSLSFTAPGSPIIQATREGKTIRVQDETFIGNDGSELAVSYTAAPLLSGPNHDGSVVVFTDATEQRRRRLEVDAEIDSLAILREIRSAIDNDRLRAFAQPIVSLKTGGVFLHELLVRILDDDGGVIAPAAFLPWAEEFGLVGEIDQWMVSQAAELAAQGHRVSVNLSAHSLVSPLMSEFIETAIARFRADASLLVLELTETALLSDTPAAQRFIARVKTLGCNLALDDFGTGYSGFAYLKSFPADLLKIDREFITDLMTNEGSQSVVRAVVELARNFGQQTIAEGVEEHETLATLRELGVDHAQGYVLARPCPVAEAMERGVTNYA